MSRLNSLTGKRPGVQKENLPSASLDRYVREIIELHDSVKGGLRNVLQNAILLGEKLHIQKTAVGHGNWLNFIQENFAFSDRTSQVYINLWQNRDKINPQSTADLQSAIKMISDYAKKEKEINPKRKPEHIYQDYKLGQTIPKREKEILREWISDKVEDLQAKAKEFEVILKNL